MAVDGTYSIAIDTQMGSRNGTLTLKANGDSLSGTLAAEGSESKITDGAVSGEGIAFKVQLGITMGTFELDFKATLNGDEIAGQVEVGGFGSFPFSGTRI